MHNDELWQLFDEAGEPIVGAGWSAVRDNPRGEDSENVGVATVFLYRRGEKGLEFLWQRRSLEIDHHPGEWDVSAGGHINLGESAPAAAMREAHEEIGAELELQDLQFVAKWSFNKNKFAWLYLVDYTDRSEEFCFDDEEVMEVKWVPYTEMDEFRQYYAKKPMRKNKVMFRVIDEWVKMHELAKGAKREERGNYAFIDGDNLHLGAKSQGIIIDYRKMRLYLKNKMRVERAFFFVGYDRSRAGLYDMLRRCGFELVFKPAVFYTGKDGSRMMKGNVDAELVLHSAAVEFDNYEKAVIITGDGDFACLIDYLEQNDKLAKIITPTIHFSLLLKPYIASIMPISIISKIIQKKETKSTGLATNILDNNQAGTVAGIRGRSRP